MLRNDYGLGFWEPEPEVYSRSGGGPRPIPPIPETRWTMPTDFPSLEGQGAIAIDVETFDPELRTRGPGAFRDGYICGVSVGTEAGFRRYYPIAHEMGENLDKDKVIAWLKRELIRPVPKVGANLLYDLAYFEAERIEVTGPFYDVQIAEPLLDENRLSYSLDALGRTWLEEGKVQNVMKEWLIRAFGETNYKSNIYRAPASVVGPYAEGDVDMPLRIFAMQRRELESRGLWKLFLLESKLIPMLLAMWKRGVQVDLSKAEQLYDKLAEQQVTTLAKIKHITGVDADIWAADSLAKIFDAAGVPYLYTEKTGKPSFRKEWLAEVDHPVGLLVMEARRLDKFKGTFVQGYILEGNTNGAIHCQFHQLRSEGGGTVSGRFSCVAPWTPIVTFRGLKKIVDIKAGDLVKTHRRRWRAVTDTWMKGVEPMLALKFSNGNILHCTIAHKLLISDGRWITVEEVANACFKEMGVTAKEYIASSLALQKQEIVCDCNSQRAQDYSFPDEAGGKVVTIEEIYFGGCREVYDITVAEDESYAACGVFSHNSSHPNLQNIPIRDPELGKLIRSIFIAEKGRRWWKFDWSQIEFRLAIHHAARMKLPGAQVVVDQYHNDPTTDYHAIVAMITGLPRSSAKSINFGIIYGLGLDALAKQLGIDVQSATRMYKDYMRRVPFVGKLRNAAMDTATKTGIIKTLSGRERHFNIWEKGNHYFPERVPGSKRAFTHKALNARLQGDAADIMKTAMVDAWESGVFDDDMLGAPHLTVHDELDGSDDNTPQTNEALAELKHIMETCVPLLVPLKADGGTGINWGAIE